MTDAFEAPTEAATSTEYASVTVEINHLLNRDDGHTVIASVFSTQTATQSALAQLSYFGMQDELNKPGVIDLLANANKVACVLVLDVPPHGQHMGQTQVIADSAIWTDLLSGDSDMNPEGTVLGAHAALIQLAGSLKAAAADQAPGDRLYAWVSAD